MRGYRNECKMWILSHNSHACMHAQIDNSDVLLSPEALKDKFQLKPEFQKYGLIKE